MQEACPTRKRANISVSNNLFWPEQRNIKKVKEEMSSTTFFQKGAATSSLALHVNVDQRPTVLSIVWNHDGTVMALGTRDGFIIYSTEMLSGENGDVVEMCRRQVDGGVLHIALYRQSSIFAFAGATKEAATTVTIWDESLADSVTPFRYTPAEKCVLARLTLDSAVCALRLHHHLLLVVDAFRIFAYSTDGLKLLETFHTPGFGRIAGTASHGSPGLPVDNNCNTIAMATFEVTESHGMSGNCSVLRMMCMGPLVGSVRCSNYFFNMKKPNVSLADAEMPAFIDSGLVSPNPHAREVQCLAVSLDGSVGVTCSSSGTSLKVIDVRKRVVTRQLNLSSVSSRTIGSISISTDATLVACLSSTGTVHVFSVQRWSYPGGDGSWSGAAAAAGQALLAAGLTSMKSVVPKAKRLEDISNFLEGEKAILTFSLSSQGGDEVSAKLRTAPRSNVSEESAAFFQELGGEDEVLRLFDVSEHNGFDPMFAALQFRPGGSVDKHSGAYGVSLLVACGSVAPHALHTKSKCLAVRVETAKGVAQLQCTSMFPKDEV